MKKILLSALFLFSSGVGFSETGQGTLPLFQIKPFFASSITSTADSNVLLASGPIVFTLVVASPTFSINPSYIQYFASTASSFGAWVTTLTPKIDLNEISAREQFYIFSTSYTYYDKRGGATAWTLYDWTDSSLSNPREFFPTTPVGRGSVGTFIRK